MNAPKDMLSRPAPEAIHRIALGLLDAARSAALRLADDADAEALHDFRVAIRKLRSAAKAHRRHLGEALGRKSRSRLRRLHRATSAARDLEVQREHLRALGATLGAPDEEIAAWLAGRLEREHAKAMRGVRAGAERAFLRWEPTLRRTLVSLRIDLEQPPAPPFGRVVAGQMRVGCAALSVELEALRDALASGIEGAQEAQTHAARLACKRLRYLIEPLRADLPGAKPLVSSLRALQAALGDLRDVQGLEARLATEQRRAEAKGSARAANLARLLRAVRAEASRRSAELESRWLEETPRDLQQSVHLLSLEAESISTSETERKYLLRALPRGLRSEQAARIEQGWLPGDRLHERLRRVEREGESTHLRTIKLGSGLTRLELEEETSSELFEALWPLTDGCRVAKRRYEIEDGGLVWIVDEFLDRDLVLAEIELPSEIIRPAIPPWMQAVVEREVTGESAYVNLRLAR